MTVTKEDLAKGVYNQTDLSRHQSISAVDSLLEIMKGCLESGEDVLISGFGKFSVKEKKGRKGRNPQTGEDLMLDARRVVWFTCSGVLRKKLNGR